MAYLTLTPPPPPGAEGHAAALRRAMSREMHAWGITPAALAAEGQLVSRAVVAWVARDPGFDPRPDFVVALDAAFRAKVREAARAYLAAWDPEGYGRWLADQDAAKEARRAEMEARLAAARVSA